ncbi:MAG: decaprenyl-phosphate phosphoribosyltransferase [Chloroflexi bacterium]|nr:decaprenyl-phosphate phosphoribosyltransferase [Chloroflexota bacterium]MBU1746788.1 decaprenyl-phosphate phosphoribosyltransferase [Chloroflexota bacterium]
MSINAAPAPASSPWRTIRGLIKTMRPKQWTKNGFVFLGLIFSDARLFFDPISFTKTFLAFIIFCLLSSTVYLVNDIADIDKDRQHPRKQRRPLPSGQIQIWQAALLALVLILVCIPAAFLLNVNFGLIATAYLVTMMAYSFWLKNIVIIDVFTIAVGFVMRAMAGPLVLDIRISPWLYVMTILLALFLALTKRRHELVLLHDSATGHRQILQEYSPRLLDQMIAVVTSSSIMAYCLYTFTAPNLPADHSMMLTIPFWLYGIFRYLYLMHQKNEGGSPDELLVKDLPTLIDVMLWGLSVLLILYIL